MTSIGSPHPNIAPAAHCAVHCPQPQIPQKNLQQNLQQNSYVAGHHGGGGLYGAQPGQGYGAQLGYGAEPGSLVGGAFGGGSDAGLAGGFTDIISALTPVLTQLQAIIPLMQQAMSAPRVQPPPAAGQTVAGGGGVSAPQTAVAGVNNIGNDGGLVSAISELTSVIRELGEAIAKAPAGLITGGGASEKDSSNDAPEKAAPSGVPEKGKASAKNNGADQAAAPPPPPSS